MPFSKANRRLTLLSMVTVVLIVVTAAVMLFASPTPKQDRLLGVLIVILGFAALWWKNEWEGRKTRHDVRDPINKVVLNVNESAEKVALATDKAAEVAVKAEQAVTITVESFEHLNRRLSGIEKSLNGDLDKRIVDTVCKVLDERGLMNNPPSVQT